MVDRPRQGEFDLIDRFFKPLSRAAPGAPDLRTFALGNDGALLTPAAGSGLVVTKDLMVAGVHYPADEEPSLVARRLLRVNLSDLAAMGATACGLCARPGPAARCRRRMGGGFLCRPRPRSGALRRRADRRRHGGDRGAGGAVADGLRHGGGWRRAHPVGCGRRRRHLRLGNHRRWGARPARRGRRALRARAGGPRRTGRALPPAGAPARARRGARRGARCGARCGAQRGARRASDVRDRRFRRTGRGPGPSVCGIGRRGAPCGGRGAALGPGAAGACGGRGRDRRSPDRRRRLRAPVLRAEA